MALLLDPHAAIWWWLDSVRLGGGARRAIIAENLPVAVSVISGLEIAIKYRIGKLPEFGDPSVRYASLMANDRFTPLAVTQEHAVRAGLLPGDHRDPFDRLIAAQALAEGLTVVTCDPAFAAFGCRVLW